MTMEVMAGILIPFAGTSLGAAMVFLLKNSISDNEKTLILIVFQFNYFVTSMSVKKNIFKCRKCKLGIKNKLNHTKHILDPVSRKN